MKNLAGLLAGALALFGVGAAHAADIYGTTTLKDAPATTPAEHDYQWTGVYIGAHVGYGNANHNITVDADRYKGGSFELLDFDGVNSHGGLLGIHAGADYAVGNILFGVLGGYSFNNAETNISLFNGAARGKLEKGDEGYIGGRAGILVNSRTLLYGGLAWVHTDYEASADIGGDEVGSVSRDFDGLKALGGVEMAFGRGWFGKLEYQHDFFGDVTWVNLEGLRVKDSLDEDKILFGLHYKFGGGDDRRSPFDLLF